MFIDKNAIPDFLRHDDKELAEIADHIVSGIREYFSKSGYKKAVIGLSGGLDSAVSFALAVKALGPENVIAVRLPYKSNNDQSMVIAAEIATAFGSPAKNLLTVDITSMVDLAWANLGEAYKPANEKERRLRIGNFAARSRMMVLMDIASNIGGLVIGTENRTEEAMAYFTIGGDSISNLEPIQDLWKVEVFQLAEHIGLPDSVLNRAPSAELWDNQTDEDDIGPFVIADTVLAGTEDMELSRDDIISRFSISPKAYDRVVAYRDKMDGKRNAPGRIAVT